MKSEFNVAVGFEANICNLMSVGLGLESQSVVLACVLKIASEWWVWKFICSRLEVKNSSLKGRKTTSRNPDMRLHIHRKVCFKLDVRILGRTLSHSTLIRRFKRHFFITRY